MYLKEIGMRAQNMIAILGSIVNIIWKKDGGVGGSYMTIIYAQEYSLW